MSLNEQHNLSGRLTIELHDDKQRCVERHCVDNLITTAGKNLIAQMFSGAVQETPQLVIAVGNGDTSQTVNDTQLEKLLGEADTQTQAPKVVDDGDGGEKVVATVKGTLSALTEGGEQVIKEAGIVFKFLSGDSVLYNRVTFPPVTRSANLQMTMTWEVTF